MEPVDPSRVRLFISSRCALLLIIAWKVMRKCSVVGDGL
jgi:hypothetical protein